MNAMGKGGGGGGLQNSDNLGEEAQYNEGKLNCLHTIGLDQIQKLDQHSSQITDC